MLRKVNYTQTHSFVIIRVCRTVLSFDCLLLAVFRIMLIMYSSTYTFCIARSMHTIASLIVIGQQYVVRYLVVRFLVDNQVFLCVKVQLSFENPGWLLNPIITKQVELADCSCLFYFKKVCSRRHMFSFVSEGLFTNLIIFEQYKKKASQLREENCFHLGAWVYLLCFLCKYWKKDLLTG